MDHHKPATILYGILKRGKDENPTDGCYEVWPRILKVDADGGLLSQLSGVLGLPRQILALLKIFYPNRDDLSSGWAPEIEKAFALQNLLGSWNGFISQIPDHCLSSLALTAELLDSKIKMSDIPEAEIKRFIEKLSEIVLEVDATGLPQELKAYLARELNELQHCLRTYGITGALPVLRQVEAMVGHCVLDPQYHDFLFNNDLGKRLCEGLAAIANVVTVAVGLPQLTKSIVDLIPK